MFFSGGTLIIDHGHGLSSTFIHLSEILVKKGDEIVQGQTIAKVGKTGRATGPHLDWRMNWFEERVDPQLLVGAMPSQ
jgi:murein DD-endopeptidase MepM/ murein hydrolase activator NlpD